MNKFYAIYILLFQIVRQVCDRGCLKCSKTNDCLICDANNRYFSSNGNCILSSVTNCMTINASGECEKCVIGYFLDLSTKKCASVIKSKVIPNCLYYSSDQTCAKCAKKYYANDGKCEPVTTLVHKCESYQDNGKCSACSSGYILTIERNACVSIPRANNCISYSFITCKACAQGYVLNKNFELTKYANYEKIMNQNNRKYFDGLSTALSVIHQCQKISDKNCQVSDSFGRCIACKEGYYFGTNNTCSIYPYPKINGCEIYNSLTSCSACLQGYILKSPTNCRAIAVDEYINDCLFYNSSISTIGCIECVSSKYLANNSCVYSRIDSSKIVSCKKLTPNDDTCKICNQGFHLTLDKKKCLEADPNCIEYEPSNFATQTLICKKCAQKFYLEVSKNGASCISGDIEGCVTYSSPNTCIECDTSGYYLQNARCSKHVIVPYCVGYSDLNYNECAVCSSGYVPFKLLTSCTNISVISNCVSYYDENTCSTCDDGYYLHNNQCKTIVGIFPNCKKVDTTGVKCELCSYGYVLKESLNSSSCEPIDDYIMDRCDKLNNLLTFNFNILSGSSACQICKEDSFPFDFGGLFVCVKDTLFDSKGKSPALIGCRQYSNDKIPVCLQCQSYLYINESGIRSCIEFCDKKYHTLINDSLDGHINTCASNSNDGKFSLKNCISAIKVFENGNLRLACLKYNTGKVTIDLTIGIEDNPSFFKDIEESTVPKVNQSFLYYGFPIFAAQKTDIDVHDNENDGNKDCEIYWKIENTLYCYRCKWGYTTKYYSENGGYLRTQCQSINGCNKDIVYSGFSAQLNRILTCHVCGRGKFITVFLGTKNDNLRFKVDGLVRGKLALRCLPLSTLESEKKPFPVDGCLIYGWIFQISNPSNPINPIRSKGCLACKPGYKLSQNFGTCKEITYCDKSNEFLANGCTLCTQTNSEKHLEFKAFADYKSNTCHPVNTDHCLFADNVLDENHKRNCRICKPGFWLNYDKVCEKILIPQCATSPEHTNFYALPTFDSADKVGEYYYYKKYSNVTSISGCDLCNPGYTALKIKTGGRQCVFSNYVKTNKFNLKNTTRYIANCEKYKNILNLQGNHLLTCGLCMSNKIPTADGSQCVDKLPNCKYASNSDISKCSVCLDPKVSVSGLCVSKNILNCKTYDKGLKNRNAFCSNCLDGFVLSSDKKVCYLGNVVGCRQYFIDMPWICIDCLQGYSLINTANSRTYCLKMSEETSCLGIDTSLKNGLRGGYYSCSKCVANNTYASIPKANDSKDSLIAQTICLRLNLIENCADYDKLFNQANGDFVRCKSCSEGYYLDESKNQCVVRVHQPKLCISFYNNQDKCFTCNASSFKTIDETDCVSFPTGIPMCSAYQSESVCLKCVSPAYLKNNTCILSTLVSHCISYRDNNVCDKCDIGYFLLDSTSCIKAQAKDCYAYSDSNTCSQCDPLDKNKGLQMDKNGITNCVDKNIPNCETSTNKFPFFCTQCKPKYYLDKNGSCLSVRNIIQNCLTYDSATRCMRCEERFVLSVNRTVCTDEIHVDVDPNCTDIQISNIAECTMCSPGYFFQDDICIPCSNNSYSNGCNACNPLNQTECLICRPGYYQKPDGNCIFQMDTILKVHSNTNFTSKGTVQMISLFIIWCFA